MKRLIYILIAITSVFSAEAQDNFLEKIKLELWDGICIPINRLHDSKTKLDMGVGMNVTYTYKETPFDFGLFAQLDLAKHITTEDIKHKGQSLSFGINSHYNIRKNSNVNPFISVGIGAGYHVLKISNATNTHQWSPCVVPRIGIEFWRCLRLATYCQLSKKSYNTFGVSLGYVIGSRSE